MKISFSTSQKFLPSLFAAGTLLLSGTGTQAAEVATVPEGYVTINIAAGSGSAGVFTFFSTPLFAVSETTQKTRGTLTGVTSNTLSDSSSTWTSNTFSQAGAPYFVRLVSGPAKGHLFQILSNTANTLTLDNSGVALDQKSIATGATGASGDSYEIIPGDTLSGLLGTPTVDNPILGGTGPNDVCDKVNILENGAWASYYYNTTASQWRKGALPVSQNNKVLRPNSPIMYSRVGNTSLKFILTGKVPDTNSVLLVNSNGSSGVTSMFPVDQSLNSFNFQSLSGWKKVGDPGITASTADLVSIYENGAWSSYHYNSTASQWRKGTLPVSQNNKVIAAGTGLMLIRSGSAGQSELTLNMPYSLE